MYVDSSESVNPQADHCMHENGRCSEQQKLMKITSSSAGDSAMQNNEPEHRGEWG